MRRSQQRWANENSSDEFPRRILTARDGEVSLVELRKAGSAVTYAVTYPKKIGFETDIVDLARVTGLHGVQRSRSCFARFAKFFHEQRRWK
jgi:hypothetical protein